MPKVQPIPTANHGGRRGRRAPRVTTALSEINVVPLVDVMLVLLIIFMVTAPMLQRGLDVNLPVASRSTPISDERVFITVPITYRQNRVIHLGDESIRVEILQERLRQAFLNSPQKQVFLRGDGGVTLSELMEVMDKLKQAGVERVGILSRLPGEP